MATAVSTVVQQPPVVQAESSQQVVVVQPDSGSGGAPPGVPTGGQWLQEKYCGPISWLVALCCCCAVICCPCDRRMVYMMNGVKYNNKGHEVCCCGCGCG